MTVFISGLGLIGGSLAKAISTRTPHTVIGTDANQKSLDNALASGAIHKVGNSENLANADIVIVALYPTAAVKFITDNLDVFKENTIVVDTCGVKKEVFDGLCGKFDNRNVHFVGGHPMAGVERSGFDHSFASLFDGASMILCPDVCKSREAVQTLSEFFSDLGFGRITISTADHHDKVIAFTSQLAHVVSSAYVHGKYATEHKGFSAGSFKDMTRVARLNADMWTELFFENRENLSLCVGELISNLQQFKSALDENNREKMHALLASGNERKIQSENL